MKKSCISCKWGAQFEGCSKCVNPAQTEQTYKDYVYHTSACDLHEPGSHPSRIKATQPTKRSLFSRIFK